MSGLSKALLALGVLAITNLGTFGFVTWRCRQEAEGRERLLAEAQQKQQAAEATSAQQQQRLDRLRVWGEFIQLQQDVNGVHAVINQLNFGNAIQALERIEKRLEGGEYGQLFQQRRPELVALVEQAKDALRRTDPMARTYLVELDQRAFSILAGASAPGELPGLTGATAEATPAPSPAPSPMLEATPALEAPAAPPAKPSPTPKPGVI
jgi:hypothetical protein